MTKTCRYCEGTIYDQEEICSNCGYNPATDTLTAGFSRKSKPAKRQVLVGPGVRNFACWGGLIIVFSLGFKYQSKIGDAFWEAKNILSGNKITKSAAASAKSVQKTPTRLIDVRSYKVPQNKTFSENRRIEGIFYDPQGKSYVVIGGELFAEGQSSGSMLIKKINRDMVVVSEAGQEKALRVNR
mgnify:CR=1 FL=1